MGCGVLVSYIVWWNECMWLLGVAIGNVNVMCAVYYTDSVWGDGAVSPPVR